MTHTFGVTDGAWFKRTTLDDALARILADPTLRLIIDSLVFERTAR